MIARRTFTGRDAPSPASPARHGGVRGPARRLGRALQVVRGPRLERGRGGEEARLVERRADEERREREPLLEADGERGGGEAGERDRGGERVGSDGRREHGVADLGRE